MCWYDVTFPSASGQHSNWEARQIWWSLIILNSRGPLRLVRICTPNALMTLTNACVVHQVQYKMVSLEMTLFVCLRDITQCMLLSFADHFTYLNILVTPFTGYTSHAITCLTKQDFSFSDTKCYSYLQSISVCILGWSHSFQQPYVSVLKIYSTCHWKHYLFTNCYIQSY